MKQDTAPRTKADLPRQKQRDQILALGSRIVRWSAPVRTFLFKFNNDWSMSFAGLLAYNLLMAILPITIALFGIFGLLLGRRNTLQDYLVTHVPPLLAQTPEAQQTLKVTLLTVTTRLQEDSLLLLLIAVALALFGGSRLFTTLEGCLCLIYRVRPRSLLRQNLLAVALMLLFSALVPLIVFAASAPTYLLAFLANQPTLKSIPYLSAAASSPLVTYALSFLSGWLASFWLLEAIYWIVPNRKIGWRKSWCGALVAATLQILVLMLFPFYVTHFMGNYVGQIGFAVILVLLFFCSATILMLGAEINAFFFEHIHPLPYDLPTFTSFMVRTWESSENRKRASASADDRDEQIGERTDDAEKRSHPQRESEDAGRQDSGKAG